MFTTCYRLFGPLSNGNNFPQNMNCNDNSLKTENIQDPKEITEAHQLINPPKSGESNSFITANNKLNENNIENNSV